MTEQESSKDMTPAELRELWEDNEDEHGNLKPDPTPDKRIVKEFASGCRSVEDYDSEMATCPDGHLGSNCDFESDRPPLREWVETGTPVSETITTFKFPDN